MTFDFEGFCEKLFGPTAKLSQAKHRLKTILKEKHF
jgi:hypothetical protein